jgi:hypothetical protein
MRWTQLQANSIPETILFFPHDHHLKTIPLLNPFSLIMMFAKLSILLARTIGSYPGGFMHRLTSRAILFSLLIIASSTTIARAVITGPPQLDQQFHAATVNSSITVITVSSQQSWGQSFTVGREGVLTQIDVQVMRDAGVTAPIQFDVRRMAGAIPDLSATGLLFTTQIPAADVPVGGFTTSFVTSISLLNNEIPVYVGDRLAILGSTTAASPIKYNWSTNGPQPYPFGNALWKNISFSNFVAQPDTDSGFQTWVAVPEPTLLGVITLTLFTLGHRARPSIRSGQKPFSC